jgi:hypothetical protein
MDYKKASLRFKTFNIFLKISFANGTLPGFILRSKLLGIDPSEITRVV